jgi:hypothetical protein
MRSIVACILVIAASVADARAGAHYSLSLAPVHEAGPPARETLAADGCRFEGPMTVAGDNDILEVSTTGKLPTDLELRVGTGGSMVAHPMDKALATPIAAILQGQPIAVWDLKLGKAICTMNAAVLNAAPTPGLDPDSDALAAMRDPSRLNLPRHAIRGHESFGRTIALYHLPSGALAYPAPPHISEKDDVELWVVLPAATNAQVEMVACDKVPDLRVAGSYQAAAAELQAAGRAIYHPQLLWRGRCAGTMTYKITTTPGGSATTSIAIDPVYRFEWGVGYMFDFGRPHQLSLRDRPADDGMSSEKFVSEAHDFTGQKPIISLSLDVCGTNPHHLTWCDRLVNPTVWIDPTRAASGFGVGLGIRPFYGLTMIAGVSVFQTERVTDGLDIKPDSTWTITGDLPTKSVFGTDSVGFAIAVSVTTDVFALLAGK